MRTFQCRCGTRVFFENFQCLVCARELGFDPEALGMLAFTPKELLRSRLRKCDNYSKAGVCNWLVAKDSDSALCRACELNRHVEEASSPEERARWCEIERAKRRLVFTLLELGLPLVSKNRDPEHGLAFDFKSSRDGSQVLTGHDNGLITLNLAEADPAQRERTREAMGERYRTLLGHFRHEVGHYYWFLLVQDTPQLGPFRKLFGDERADYAAALAAHYRKEQGDTDYEQFISHYAASHPWEDFAETFAHYLHMVDTLETAVQFGLVGRRGDLRPGAAKFDVLVGEWYGLSVALNSLNRSMGLQDAYPFAVAPTVKEKLRYVHDLLHSAARARRHERDNRRSWLFPWRRPRQHAA